MVFTFSNHPLSVIAPDKAPLQIGDTISKENILAELGVDILVNIPFTRKFAKVLPDQFLTTLQENFAPSYIVVGPNFSFGYRGKGNPRMFLYPLAITLVLLALFSSLFGGRRAVYLGTTLFTLVAAVGDALNALPAGGKELSAVQSLLGIYQQLPFFSIGMIYRSLVFI